MANFTKKKTINFKDQVVAMAEKATKPMLASKQTTVEMLGIVKNRKNQTEARSAVPSKSKEVTFPEAVGKYYNSIQKMLASSANM